MTGLQEDARKIHNKAKANLYFPSALILAYNVTVHTNTKVLPIKTMFSKDCQECSLQDTQKGLHTSQLHELRQVSDALTCGEQFCQLF